MTRQCSIPTKTAISPDWGILWPCHGTIFFLPMLELICTLVRSGFTEGWRTAWIVLSLQCVEFWNPGNMRRKWWNSAWLYDILPRLSIFTWVFTSEGCQWRVLARYSVSAPIDHANLNVEFRWLQASGDLVRMAGALLIPSNEISLVQASGCTRFNHWRGSENVKKNFVFGCSRF